MISNLVLSWQYFPEYLPSATIHDCMVSIYLKNSGNLSLTEKVDSLVFPGRYIQCISFHCTFKRPLEAIPSGLLQEVMSTNWNIPSEQKKMPFYCEMTALSERLWNLLGGILNPTGNGSAQQVLGNPACAARWDWMISTGAFQPQLFCNSVKILKDSLMMIQYRCIAGKIATSAEKTT